MGINDTIRNFIERYKERKRAYKDYEENERMIESFHQKRLPHNERVLNKLMEMKRQENIKKSLDFELSRRRNEDRRKASKMLGGDNKLWKDTSIMHTKNLFQNNKSILR